jgi:hypothetical protein
MSDDMKELYAAMVQAQRIAQAVAKQSTNTFHRYKYASAEALIEEGRSALSEAGLALLTTTWSVTPTVDDGIARSSVLRVTYLLVHTSGQHLQMVTETSIIPEKGRPQDKAEATALTYNLGYFIRGLLLLPREDESASVDQRRDLPATSDAFDASFITSVDGALNAIEAASSVDELAAVGKQVAKLGLDAANAATVRVAWATRRGQISKHIGG